MKRTREFGIGVVLSAVTGVLLCDIGEVYEILNFLTGDSLYTHQLPRVGRECAPYIFACYPELLAINTSSVDTNNWREFLAGVVEQYGPSRTLEPMPDGVHEYRNPVSEIKEMAPHARIIAINISADE